MKALRRILLLLLLVATAYAGFRWGPAVFPRLEEWAGIERDRVEEAAGPQPTPELAEETLDRFEALRAGTAGTRMALGGTELTAVIRHAIPGLLPAGVSEPEVRLQEGRVHLEARVSTASFPRLPALDQVVGFLPDTLPVEVRGSLMPYDQVNLALVVDRIRAARIPVPSRMVGDVLDELGGMRRPGAPEDALAVPLPDGLDSVFVQQDSLILIAEG
mgnify:CR=1 FL=1